MKTKGIFEDQPEAVERISSQHGKGHVNPALLPDGLRAEHRYFATPRGKLIIADSPDHVPRKGVPTQSKRHGFIASLLGIPHLVVDGECDIPTLESRDPQGLWSKARAGEIRDFTGVASPHEAPVAQELRIDTAADTAERVGAPLSSRGLLRD